VEADGTREISRLAVSFNEMTKELASIETLRNDFISNISHEFKTPIVSIRGFAKRLKKDTLTQQQREEYLDIIISETERLTRLSSNVLLLSKLESTDKVLEKTIYSLDEQIRRSILILKPQLEKKNLELEVELQPTQITANEEMLSHVWLNLLENAIKFSHEAGTIKAALQSNGKVAVVSICDTGIGMDTTVKRHVFDKFYQGEQSRSIDGNGLGLSLVKRILELSNGHATIDSTFGEGTCITIWLPING
jgi:signal transduction histidine kinase